MAQHPRRKLAPSGPDEPLRIWAPRRQRADAPLVLRVEGAVPGASVTVGLVATRPDGTRERASAVFACVDGTVDVARDAPVAGYDEVDSDGLLRLLAADAGAPGAPGATGATDRDEPGREPDPLAPITLSVSATAAGREQGSATVIREIVAPGVRRRPAMVAGGTGLLFQPPPDAPWRPAVVALPALTGAPGERAAGLLASRGYPVLLLPVAAAHAAAVWPARDLAAASGCLADAGVDTVGALVVVLDLVPDRRSRTATVAWERLLEVLREQAVVGPVGARPDAFAQIP